MRGQERLGTGVERTGVAVVVAVMRVSKHQDEADLHLKQNKNTAAWIRDGVS